MTQTPSITVLLRQFSDGDKSAMDRVVALVYDELRRIAGGRLREERQGHTLQPTALVHEAYARLIGQDRRDYQDRIHFFSVAARVMRQVLIDHARAKSADKRGGRVIPLSLDEARDSCVERPAVMLQVDDALNALERKDPRKAQLVELRFFGGLTAEESADLLKLPVQKVRSELRVAQAWLQRELDGAAAGDQRTP